MISEAERDVYSILYLINELKSALDYNAEPMRFQQSQAILVSRLSSGMTGSMDRFQTTVFNVGINLSGANIRMPEHFL